MADQKVRVTKELGQGAWLGLMDPQLNMVTNYGTITGLDSGNYQVTVSGQGTHETFKAYTHDLFITELVATGTFSYPSGDGAIPFGDRGLSPAGGTPGLSGLYYHKGGAGGVYGFYDR